ncbi:Signal peptidase complex catalytic subunit SEC11A [Bienertia sinuspersici]
MLVAIESHFDSQEDGDVLFLNTMIDHPVQSGEIVVFNIEGKEIPIVHRVIKVKPSALESCDNNSMDDSYGIYADGQLWLESHQVIGRVIGYVPFIGWATILMTEKPLLKYLLVGGLSLLFITSR